MEKLIFTDDIEFSYVNIDDEKKKVLLGITTEIKRGELVAVIGHNGSGKSTFAKHLNAINLPESGTVYVNGLDTKAPENLIPIRKNVGMVFQNPDNQLVATIVEEDVAFAPENLGIDPKEIRVRVDEALKAVGLYEYRMHAPHKLSGGQKQRVAIAGIIAMRPECIVLDEPTAMLDPNGRHEVLATIRKLCDEENIACVLITHYMTEAARCDRVIVLDHGKIIKDGPPEEIFEDVVGLKKIGLDVPQTCELAYELKKSGIDLGHLCLFADDCSEALYEKVFSKLSDN